MFDLQVAPQSCYFYLHLSTTLIPLIDCRLGVWGGVNVAPVCLTPYKPPIQLPPPRSRRICPPIIPDMTFLVLLPWQQPCSWTPVIIRLQEPVGSQTGSSFTTVSVVTATTKGPEGDSDWQHRGPPPWSISRLQDRWWYIHTRTDVLFKYILLNVVDRRDDSRT